MFSPDASYIQYCHKLRRAYDDGGRNDRTRKGMTQICMATSIASYNHCYNALNGTFAASMLQGLSDGDN